MIQPLHSTVQYFVFMWRGLQTYFLKKKPSPCHCDISYCRSAIIATTAQKGPLWCRGIDRFYYIPENDKTSNRYQRSTWLLPKSCWWRNISNHRSVTEDKKDHHMPFTSSKNIVLILRTCSSLHLKTKLYTVEIYYEIINSIFFLAETKGALSFITIKPAGGKEHYKIHQLPRQRPRLPGMAIKAFLRSDWVGSIHVSPFGKRHIIVRSVRRTFAHFVSDVSSSHSGIHHRERGAVNRRYATDENIYAQKYNDQQSWKWRALILQQNDKDVWSSGRDAIRLHLHLSNPIVNFLLRAPWQADGERISVQLLFISSSGMS